MDRLTKFDCMVGATAPGGSVEIEDFLGKSVAHGTLVKRLFDYEEIGTAAEFSELKNPKACEVCSDLKNDQMYFEYCKKANKNFRCHKAKFCGNCGRKLSEGSL